MTPLIEATNLARATGVGSLHVKIEFAYTSGTHKERGTESIAMHASKRGHDCITAGSCGNYGAAIALQARRKGLKCVVFTPASFLGTRAEEMCSYGATVLAINGLYEDAVAASRRFAADRNAYDANPGGVADASLLGAYGGIAAEIDRQLEGEASAVWVPVGNGTTLAGIYGGFVSRSRNPAMHAIGSSGNTAATASAIAGTHRELSRDKLHPTRVNEPLVNWSSAHASEVILAVQRSNGSAIELADDELIVAAEMLRAHESIAASPAGAAGLAGLIASPKSVRRQAKHVVVLTAAASIT